MTLESDPFTYRVHRMRLTGPSLPGELIVVDGLRPAQNEGRHTRLIVTPDGVLRGNPVVEAEAYIEITDGPPNLTTRLRGARTVTVEVWSRIPQPDPELYLHVTIEPMAVEDWVPADGPGWLGGRVVYAPGEDFMWQQVCTGPLPELTP